MKKHIVFTIGFLTVSALCSAQMGYGGYGSGGYGRRNDMSQYSKPQNNTKKQDPVEAAVAYYKKELSLDDFQEAAVKQVFEDERKNMENLMQNPDMTDEERRDKSTAITDRIDAKMLKMLSPEQIEKFEKLKEKRKKH